MADAVTSQTIFDGGGYVVMKFTNVSDGTGESAVTKVDVSALTPAATQVAIERIWFSTDGMAVRLLWDADADVLALAIPANQTGELDMTGWEGRGIRNNAGAGITGDIQLTTVGHTSGDSYVIILAMRKVTA